MRRIAFAAAVLLAAAGPAAAQKIKLGLVRVANSGPTFIALERGYFAAEGIDAEIVFFDGGAVPISVAVVSGDIDIGETATSASLFSLAAQGALKIVGGETREAQSFHNFALAASNRGYAAGLKTFTDLPGHSLAVPQIGSSAHYRLSLLADKFHFDVKSVRLLAVQSIPNVISSMKGGQADGTINAATQLVPMFDAGDAKLIGWLSDEVLYQSAMTFVSTRTAAEKRDIVVRFLRAFRKGARDYHDAFTGPGELRQDGPTAPAILSILSKYTGQTPAQIELAVAYCPPDGGLDSQDIKRQVDWFVNEGLLKGPIDVETVLDRSYYTELPVR